MEVDARGEYVWGKRVVQDCGKQRRKGSQRWELRIPN